MPVLFAVTPYSTSTQCFYGKGAAYIIVSWFAGCKWKNNSKRYTQLPILFHNFYSVYIIYRCDHTYLLTPWSRVLLEKLTSKLCR